MTVILNHPGNSNLEITVNIMLGDAIIKPLDQSIN